MCPECAPELPQYYNWEAAHAKCEIVNLVCGKDHLVPKDWDIFEEDWERMKERCKSVKTIKGTSFLQGCVLDPWEFKI